MCADVMYSPAFSVNLYIMDGWMVGAAGDGSIIKWLVRDCKLVGIGKIHLR